MSLRKLQKMTRNDTKCNENHVVSSANVGETRLLSNVEKEVHRLGYPFLSSLRHKNELNEALQSCVAIIPQQTYKTKYSSSPRSQAPHRQARSNAVVPPRYIRIPPRGPKRIC